MASTYLSRTPSTGVNRRTFTFSAWIKRARINDYDIIFEASNGSHSFQMATNPTGDGDCIRIYDYTGTTNLAIKTNQAFRDLSAWYHIVLAVDTTQATNTNRAKFYVNGEQVTSLATSTYPSQNYDTGLNNSVPMQIGRQQSSSNYFDGSMAHVNFIDGLAYPASTFGETDSLTGIWKPITSPSVTYGTNGFFLKFASSGSMGTDSSGNSNNFTVNGTLTQTQDTPSNVFATMNPLFAGDANITYSNGNLKLTSTASAQKNAVSTIAVSSGKWYCEMVSRNGTNYPGFGIMDSQSVLQTSVSYLGSTADSYCMFQQGDYYNNGSASSTGITWGVGSIMGIAIDLDSATKTIKFYKDGAEVHSATIATPANGYVFAASHNTNGTISEINFGNGYFGTTAVASAGTNASGIGIFEYDVPTGYTALSTKGLNL